MTKSIPAQTAIPDETPPLRWRGFFWSVPIGALTAFSLLSFEPWAYWVTWMTSALVLATWICATLVLPTRDQRVYWPITMRLFAGVVILLLLKHHGFLASVEGETILKDALPWPVIAGVTLLMTAGLGWFLTAPAQRQKG